MVQAIFDPLHAAPFIGFAPRPSTVIRGLRGLRGAGKAPQAVVKEIPLEAAQAPKALGPAVVEEIPLEQRGAIQSGMGIGEAPPQGQLFPESPTEAVREPLVDVTGIEARQAREAEVARGQQSLPEGSPPGPAVSEEVLPEPQVVETAFDEAAERAVFSPLEEAQLKVDEAQASLEAALERGLPVPKFGTPERAEFDAARRAASAEGRPIKPKTVQRQEARQALKDARVALRLIEQDAQDFRQTISFGPEHPDFHRVVLQWFRDFLKDPWRIDNWGLQQQYRTAVRSERINDYKATVEKLISEGVASENAMRFARASMSGELPSVSTGIKEIVTPQIRQVLFDEVHLVLANDGFAMLSTEEALNNALAGREVPRIPGSQGGSAFSRLARVFGDEMAEAISQRQTLGEVISLRAGRRGTQTNMGPGGVVPPGSQRPPIPFQEQPGTQGFGTATIHGAGRGRQVFGELPTDRLLPDEAALDAPTQPLRLQPLPGPFPESGPRLSAAERSIQAQELDLRIRRQNQGQLPLEGIEYVEQPPLGAPQAHLIPEPAPGPFRTSVPEPWLADMPQGLTPGAQERWRREQRRYHAILENEHLRHLTETTKERMIRWAKIAALTPVDFGNLIRANMASVDMSYLRQQAPLIAGHPLKFIQTFPDAFRALWSDTYVRNLDDAIQSDPFFMITGEVPQWYRAVGSLGREAGEVAEEVIVQAGRRPIQRLAANMPHINISNRAFVSGLNSHNASIRKGYIRSLMEGDEAVLAAKQSGLKRRRTISDPFPRQDVLGASGIKKRVENFDRVLANLSGRGPLGPLKGGDRQAIANNLFFSIRLNTGRFLLPKDLIWGDSGSRKLAWKSMMSFVGLMSGILLTGRAAGWWDLETDPRSSDFMQAKIGRLRLDPWGGYRQFAVLYARMLPVVGGIKSLDDGKISDYDPVNGVTRFLRNKAAPMVHNVLRGWTGKDFIGREIDRTDWKAWLSENIQLSVQEVMDAYEGEGLLGAFIAAPAATFGVGVTVIPLTLNDVSKDLGYGNYYDLPLLSPKRKTVRDALKERRSQRETQMEEERKQRIKDRATEREAERKRKYSERFGSGSSRPRPSQRGVPRRGSRERPIPAFDPVGTQ